VIGEKGIPEEYSPFQLTGWCRRPGIAPAENEIWCIFSFSNAEVSSSLVNYMNFCDILNSVTTRTDDTA